MSSWYLRSTPIVSETDRYTGLLSGGFSGGMLAAFFGVGLLLALTPCVFPMVPILSGILVGQRQTVTAARGFLLSSVYVVAMALTYAAAGVLAGLFGQNLQARVDAISRGLNPDQVGGAKSASGFAIGLRAARMALMRVIRRFFLPYEPSRV